MGEARRRRSRIRRSDSSVGRVGWYTVKILKRRTSFEKATNRVENLKTEVRRCFFKAIVAHKIVGKFAIFCSCLLSKRDQKE